MMQEKLKKKLFFKQKKIDKEKIKDDLKILKQVEKEKKQKLIVELKKKKQVDKEKKQKVSEDFKKKQVEKESIRSNKRKKKMKINYQFPIKK